jgi:hypothetical protein
MPEGMNPLHKVSYPAAVQNALKDLCARAIHHGLGEQVLAALKTIDEQLRSDPLNFGDPTYSLPQAKLQMMQRLLPPLAV